MGDRAPDCNTRSDYPGHIQEATQRVYHGSTPTLPVEIGQPSRGRPAIEKEPVRPGLPCS
jgi:hypothetical protein